MKLARWAERFGELIKCLIISSIIEIVYAIFLCPSCSVLRCLFELYQVVQPYSLARERAYLERQQAAVDLGCLVQRVAVVAVDVRAALVARKVDQGELAVERSGAVVAAQADLQDGVGARRVGVGRGLAGRPGEVVTDGERDLRRLR